MPAIEGWEILDIGGHCTTRCANVMIDRSGQTTTFAVTRPGRWGGAPPMYRSPYVAEVAVGTVPPTAQEPHSNGDQLSASGVLIATGDGSHVALQRPVRIAGV